MKIVPFAEEHVEPAGALLEERHRRHREAEPLPPGDVDYGAEVRALWEQDGASGVFAEGGYLLATRLDESWGPNAWIELAGHAVREPELVRDLYAHAAARWVEEGRTRHYAVVPATDAELVDAWFRLGFGQQQAHGMQEVPDENEVAVPPGFAIGPPDPVTLEELIDVDLALPRHQSSSPVFSSRIRDDREESRDEWLKTLPAPTRRSRSATGTAARSPAGQSSGPTVRDYYGLGLPQDSCYLAFAVTLPEARGSGTGVALTAASFA